MIEVGARTERRFTVGEEQLASRYGSGLADVLATPALIGFCEETARRAIDPTLPADRVTVGLSVRLQHLAPTPPEMEVTVRAELVEVDGRRLRFRLEAWDEVERVAEGEHERFIVDAARFAERAGAKRHAREHDPGKSFPEPSAERG